MNGIRLIFELALRSDYHVGSGHGLGTSVDSALLRDGDGKPVLRGTMLAALMREGMRQLLGSSPFAPHYPHTVEHDDYGGQCTNGRANDPCWECRIFGTPRFAKRWVFSSARPREYKIASPTAADTRAALSWGGEPATRVRINLRTRRAAPRELFTHEEGDRRLAFRFTVVCDADDANSLPEALLLVAAARMVRRLGAHRTRGRGECLITLVEANYADGSPVFAGEGDRMDVWLSHFENEWLHQPARTPQPHLQAEAIALPDLKARITNAPPYCIRVIARAEEPILIALRAEAGNEFESLTYIPGGAVLGALATRTAARQDVAQAEVATLFSELFARGRIRFGNLHPANYDGTLLHASCISPFNLMTCKLYPGYEGDGHGVWVMGKLPMDDVGHIRCPVCDADLEKLGSSFTLQSAPKQAKVRRREELHPRINPRSGRVSQADLFGYVALDAGQYFVGDIVCQDKSDWQALCQLSNVQSDAVNHLRVGKATRRGYGLLALVFQTAEAADSQVREPFDERVKSLDKPVFLTLLSDAILTDTWGRFITSFKEANKDESKNELLAKLLGFPEGSVQIVTETLAVGERIVDGFNAQHGLPRWRDVGLAAGSSVAMRLTGVTLDQLRTAERRGIGLRRAEGFGRIVFNHPFYTLVNDPPYSSVKLLSEAAIQLPEVLQSAKGNASSLIAAESEFRTQLGNIFDKRTDKEWQTFRNTEFGSVVRLLLAARQGEPDSLRAQLGRLQKPDEVLQTLGAEAREKNVWFSKGDGEKGMLKLLKDNPQAASLLSELERAVAATPEAARTRCYVIGVEMLVERIAAQVRQDRKP